MGGKTPLSVKKAVWVGGYKLLIVFNDGKEQLVDFAGFIGNNNKASLLKYKLPIYFKQFHIEDGNVVWGRDWDLVFPIHQLYEGNIN